MAIGIGIDDSLHFLLKYKRTYSALGENADPIKALKITMNSTGQAIVFTSLALVCGFSMFFLSNFKPMIYFAALNVSAISLATVATLLLIPSLIHLTQKQRKSHV